MWTVDDEENLSTLVKTRDMIGEVEPDWAHLQYPVANPSHGNWDRC